MSEHTNPLRQLSDKAHEIPSITHGFLVVRKYQVVPDHEELDILRQITDTQNNQAYIPEYVKRRNQVPPSRVFRKPPHGRDDDKLLHASFPVVY